MFDQVIGICYNMILSFPSTFLDYHLRLVSLVSCYIMILVWEGWKT